MGRPTGTGARKLGVLLAGAAFVLAAAGCGGTNGLGSADATLVSVNEHDFRIAVSPQEVPAGEVVIEAQNHGPDMHELIVVRAGDAGLPVRSDGMTVDEERLEHATLGALEPGEPGTVRDLHLHLRPGRYVLLCNMAGHYMGGMHTTLVVR